MMKDFRDFMMRGNVLDLAVAVIIGIAFNAVVNSFVDDVLMQKRRGRGDEPDVLKTDEVVVLEEIRDLLRTRG